MTDDAEIADLFAPLVGRANVLTGEAVGDDYGHDEALTATPQLPAAVVRPETADEVANVLREAWGEHTETLVL